LAFLTEFHGVKSLFVICRCFFSVENKFFFFLILLLTDQHTSGDRREKRDNEEGESEVDG